MNRTRCMPCLVTLLGLSAGTSMAAGGSPAGPAASQPTRSADYQLLGPSVIVDPGFGYYRDRSADSIASEIRANGYRVVHCIADPSAHVRRDIVEALHHAGIGVWLQVFGNGTYSRRDLPEEWPSWAMVTRTELTGGKLPGSFQRLCLNNAAYRKWKKADLAAALKAAPFDGIEIAESHWPEYPGVESPAFGCFCDACRTAFRKQYPQETDLPDIIHADSPRSPAKNPELWRKYLQFRQKSLTAYLDDLVNGPGGLRESSPGRKVCIWGLGLSEPNGVERMREISGQDAGEAAALVKPDVYCIQTHWPDWLRPDLPPDYVRTYLPFVEQVRQRSPGMPLMIQTDVGSAREMIRDRDWIRKFEASCHNLGIQSTTLYEYFIAGWCYHEPPRIAEVTRRGKEIRLIFTRRLDPVATTRPAAFELEPGRVASVRVDGNIAILTVAGVAPMAGCRLTIRGLSDDPKRRLFAGGPASVLEQEQVTVPADTSAGRR